MRRATSGAEADGCRCTVEELCPACDGAAGRLVDGMRATVGGRAVAIAAALRCQGCGRVRLSTQRRAHGYRFCGGCERDNGAAVLEAVSGDADGAGAGS